MKFIFKSQIIVLAIIVALIGSFNSYGQNSRSKFIRPNEQNSISKYVLLNMQKNSKIINSYSPANIRTVLYDQTAGTTTSGIASQDFETVNDAYDCQAADDFTVPAGGWTVRQVIVGGFYSTTGPAAGFNIYFYPNAAGVPGAAPVYSALAQPYSFDGSYFTIQLGTDAVLPAGTYWLSVQCRMDFGTGGQWYWNTSTGTFGNTAQWQNPLDGFGTVTCVTWNPITTCNSSTETELSFALTDELPPPTSLPVIEDFEAGLFPPFGWTQSPGGLWYGSDAAGGGVSGYGVGQYSTFADFYDFFPATDELISLDYSSAGATNPRLNFDWAYADYSGTELDEMDIYYSTDGGTTWTILAAMYNGAAGDNNLNPFGLTTSSPYFPANNEWSTRSLNLPAGTNKVKFTAISDYGNLLWLDNIKISGELFEDSFENPPYTYPGQVACQNPTDWTTWSFSPCGNDDATISNAHAYTGSQAALIDVSAPRNVDLVKPLGDKTSGKWYISFFMYIPTGGAGYFNTLAVLPPSADWGMECYFNAGGAGELDNVPGAPITFTWHEDTWNQVLISVDFTQTPTTAEFWFGKVGQLAQLYTWDWTQGATITDQLAGNDFYGATAVDQMFIDDYYFSDIAPPIQRLANDVGTFSIDMDYQYAPGTITPYATVKNYGTDPNTFNVTMTISGGYSSTKTVPSIADGETYQVTFDPWTQSTVGPYTIDVCTQLATDDNPDNDCQTRGVHIWDDSGVWTSGADYPITTYNGTGVSYNDGTNDWLFVMGGNTTSGLRTECYKYNVTANTWTAIASLPAGRLIHAAAAVGNYIYVIGGSDGTVYTNTTYRYDIAANSWTLLPAVVPTTIGWCRAVSYMDRYIYVAGGYDGTSLYLNTIYLYDTVTGTYSVASPMPLAVFGGGFGITGNTLVYAAGAYESGISNTVMVGTINSGNPALISWATMRNTYPGIGKPVTGHYGASLVAEMISSSTGLAKNNHSPDAVVWPAGAIYRTHAHTWGTDAIIMAGGTPTADYIAADPGPCYVYKPGTDTWTAQENVPVPIGAHQSGTFNSGNTWTYVIASGFGLTAPSAATQIYTQTLGGTNTFPLSVAVSSGWNMTSVPGTNPAGMGVSTWWSHLTGTVYKFVPGTGYVAVTTTTPTEGYWLKNTLTETYTYPSIQIVAHNTVSATAGWNMFGGYEDVVPVTSLTTTPSGQIVYPIYKYVPGTGYATATDLIPGYGYWVKVAGNCQITIPDLPVGGAQKIVEYFKDNWGKITITDAAGSNYTLYAVNGKVDLNKYELPPLPPAGSFDIRFGSGRIAEDLTSGTQSIEMRGVVYPVKVSVINMSITLQDETGKIINTTLNPDQELTISNPSVSKLLILSGETAPTEYSLEQNYPNPFNPSTTIKFSIPEASNVTLTIYNMLGQKVTELVNGKMETGRYSYEWNARNVASGMYIYELRTDKFVSIKKMLLLK